MRWSPVAPLALCLALLACSSATIRPEDYAAEIPAAVELSAADRSRVEDLTERALLQSVAGLYREAAAIARKAIAIDARAGRARAVLGSCLHAEAREKTPPDASLLHRAEGELLLARRIAKNDAEVRFLYADFLRAEGHLSRAASELEELLKQKPGHLRGLRAAAGVRFELAEERQAAQLFERLLKKAPNDLQARYRLGWCRARIAETLQGSMGTLDGGSRRKEALDSWRAAAEHFAKYRAGNGGDIQGYLGEAHARFQERRLRGGKLEADEQSLKHVLALYTEAARIAPKQPEALFGAGVVRESVGDMDGARKNYQAALLRDPDHVPTLLNLIGLLDANGEKIAARNMAAHALTLELNSAERSALQAYVKG